MPRSCCPPYYLGAGAFQIFPSLKLLVKHYTNNLARSCFHSSHYEKFLATGEVKCIDDVIPFEIPESWCWVRLRHILNIGSARRVHEKDWRSSGIPFYRAREIGKLAEYGHVDNDLFIEQELYDQFSQSGVPLSGDLMVTAVGTIKPELYKELDLLKSKMKDLERTTKLPEKPYYKDAENLLIRLNKMSLDIAECKKTNVGFLSKY